MSTASSHEIITLPTVLVTGSSSGIGRACALHLAANNFHVFAGVRKPEDGERLVAEAAGNLSAVTIDVCDDDSIAKACASIKSQVGERGLFALVNNAGVSLSSPLEYATREHIDRQLQTNFYGPVLLTSALLPLLRQAKGRVVNISSGAGVLATPIMGIYSASKFALEGMSDVLRVELRSWGIKVVVVEPGFVASNIHDKNFSDMDVMLAGLPEEGLSHYGEAIRKFKGINKKLEEKKATPAAKAGEVVLRALTDRRPRSRYQVGADAKLLGAIGWMFSDRTRDRIAGMMVGL